MLERWWFLSCWFLILFFNLSIIRPVLYDLKKTNPINSNTVISPVSLRAMIIKTAAGIWPSMQLLMYL